MFTVRNFTPGSKPQPATLPTCQHITATPDGCHGCISIRGTLYLYHRLEVGSEGEQAVRLVKPDGESYTVAILPNGMEECDCWDYLVWRQPHGERCKHLHAAYALELLREPVYAPEGEAEPEWASDRGNPIEATT